MLDKNTTFNQNEIFNLINELMLKTEKLTLKVIALSKENQELKSKIEILTEENTRLKEQLNKNSKNSSKPPSSDGFKKKIPNNRIKSGRKSGGQEGHEGHTLTKSETPDEIIELKKDKCECGCNLEEVEGKIETRQVYDLPEIKINITEYRSYEKVCPVCNNINKSEFPENVTNEVQYGENFQTLAVYLTNYQLLPLNRTVELLRSLTGQKISEGTIVNITERLYDKLEDVDKEIKENLQNSEVMHVDETGMRSNGKTQWVHVASTDELTYYEMHEKRGKEAMDTIGILKEYEGTIVHDHLAAYYCYDNCLHAECNAHNLRALIGIIQNDEHEWAMDMINLLLEIKTAKEKVIESNGSCFKDEALDKYFSSYKSIIQKGRKEDELDDTNKLVSKTGKPQKSNALKLLNKLDDYDIETLAFMFDFDIPFDNNLVERDVRMIKLRQKISGCFRGENGAKHFLRIRSFISTCRKQGQDVLASIKNAIKGTPSINFYK